VNADVRVGIGLAGCAVTLLGLASAAAAQGKVGFAPGGVGVEQHVGARVPLELSFRDSTNRRVELGALLGRGRPAVLVLAYSRCAMLCSVVLRQVTDNVRGLGLEPGRDFDLVTVSIDPRETPQEIGRAQATALARAGYEGQLARWPFLVGDQRSIARVADSVGFRYQWDARTEQYAHPAVVIVLSDRGEVTRYLQGASWRPGELASALRGSNTAPAATLDRLLQCFRPDTTQSKYGTTIRRGLASGGALTLAGLLLVIARARRARRA
jgi:protein SCO1